MGRRSPLFSDFEVRTDDEGEYFHLVTLWKATEEEQKLYEDRT